VCLGKISPGGQPFLKTIKCFYRKAVLGLGLRASRCDPTSRVQEFYLKERIKEGRQGQVNYLNKKKLKDSS